VADALPSGDEVAVMRRLLGLHVAAGAVRASEAANKQDSHAYRYQNGKDASVTREPVNQVMHILETHMLDKMFRR
jgi:hypothetical protein